MGKRQTVAAYNVLNERFGYGYFGIQDEAYNSRFPLSGLKVFPLSTKQHNKTQLPCHSRENVLWTGKGEDNFSTERHA